MPQSTGSVVRKGENLRAPQPDHIMQLHVLEGPDSYRIVYADSIVRV